MRHRQAPVARLRIACGIGRAAAIALAREGADVAINYLRVEEPDAREVVQLIQAAGRKAVALPGDIRDEAFCQRWWPTPCASWAGSTSWSTTPASRRPSPPSPISPPSSSTRRSRPTSTLCSGSPRPPGRASAPEAAIINTASVEAYEPSPLLLDYAQTKACIVAFTKALARQVAKHGIRVNAVAPGPFWTPLQVSGGQPQEKIEQFGGQTPLAGPGSPPSSAPYATGQVYGAAGGIGNP
jgi:NAD(P)-dependent dehydrogenase (short-subunit alcohol dehydrogenase family)